MGEIRERGQQFTYWIEPDEEKKISRKTGSVTIIKRFLQPLSIGEIIKLHFRSSNKMGEAKILDIRPAPDRAMNEYDLEIL